MGIAKREIGHIVDELHFLLSHPRHLIGVLSYHAHELNALAHRAAQADPRQLQHIAAMVLTHEAHFAFEFIVEQIDREFDCEVAPPHPPTPTWHPRPRPTGGPRPRPTGRPRPRPTGGPRPRPTGHPRPRPSGEPRPRPTGGPRPRPSLRPRPSGRPRPRPSRRPRPSKGPQTSGTTPAP